MLEVRELTKRYAGTLAVDRVSFTISPGAILGYLGPNGAGKSTTVKPSAVHRIAPGDAWAVRGAVAGIDSGFRHPPHLPRYAFPDGCGEPGGASGSGIGARARRSGGDARPCPPGRAQRSDDGIALRIISRKEAKALSNLRL